MAFDMFLKIEGPELKGESKDDTHTEEIDVLAWSWGSSQSGTFHTGGGGGAGKVNVQDLSVTKWVDAASPEIFKSICNGQHYDTATLTVRKAGTEPLEYLLIEMTKVMFTSQSTGGSGGEDQLTENVTLNFAEVKVSYQPQSDTGGAEGGAIEAAWNIEGNVEA
jgi:type VI secretion system secreted protein Hcp